MEHLDDLADAWLKHRYSTGGENISDNTLKSYRRDLKVWVQLISSEVGHRPTLNDLRHEVVSDSLDKMRSVRQDSDATRRRAFTTMASFVKWLLLRGKLEKDPLIGLSAPKTGKKTPVAFEDKQLGQILDAAASEDSRAKSPAPALDVACVLLLSAGGLRATEAVELRMRGVRTGDEPLIRVDGKGAKQRSIPLPREADAFLQDYLSWRYTVKPGKPADNDHFLLNPAGQPLTRFALDYRIKKIYARAGVPAPEGAVSHALRHTYAMSSLNGGASINEIQELLGHESLTTTGLYLKATAAHLREAATTSAAARHLRKRT